MKYLDLTLLVPAENLACDEVLLDLCEDRVDLEVLRFWESASHFVVLGRGNKADVECNRWACAAHDIPLLRRTSGGGAVLQGPGCLNYSLVLQIDAREPLGNIAGTNRYILERHAAALETLVGTKTQWSGCTDLAVDGLKFSGNAQHRKRRCLLFHGSILLNLDLAMLDLALSHPSREPEYRRNRSHREFVRNLNLSPESIKAALRVAWDAKEPLAEVPHESIKLLAREKYDRAEWNLKL
jgi:lipoate-protein ligase A